VYPSIHPSIHAHTHTKVFDEPEKTYMVMELLTGGNVMDRYKFSKFSKVLFLIDFYIETCTKTKTIKGAYAIALYLLTFI
jgi:hypothetical protein